MTTRRSRGDGGLHWDERRQRWIATATVGFDGRGKRITRRASGRTKTEAKTRLRTILRDHEDGLTIAANHYTVGDAVRDWLEFGLSGRAASTAANYRTIAHGHVIAPLGAHRLRDLTAEDVERWLRAEARTVSTRTLRLMHSLLSRSVRHAMARDKVKRNVVLLCDVPTGQAGRRSKSLSFDQAEAVLDAARGHALHAYVVLSLLLGARTEELRAMHWHEVDLLGQPDAKPPVPPSIAVYRSVRAGGDTKTTTSRRRLALPQRCVDALHHHLELLGRFPAPHELVFATSNGTELDAHNVRRSFRRIVADAGLEPREWTPRELRHSFVSLLSASGVRIEDISRLVGHSGTAVTEKVYRHQLHAVLDEGARAMDGIFPERARGSAGDSHSVSHSPRGSGLTR
ncbi:site-specific integrase [Pseudonocardia broussonetiae]|uniref:Site-specific integrase n=1 Tax=Pseudonocardia broussonetiae TaxID=2736640 RepID=A0A6M6JQZ7_9PSEU|nr:site-specific integrase [Pseudonocardia broussonetiae]QJY49062.1 site-specific integrase [Pseudonocardia broussonetiae]